MLTDKQDYDEIYQKYKNLVMKAAYKYSGELRYCRRYYTEYISAIIYVYR